MEDTAKYLIHADFLADGVVERSDVVGAVFGQTEGLLGDDLDIRDLQQSSKLGRIDVEVEHDNGQSLGDITIASSLDRVETAVLAAALESLERIGPSHASVEVARIEDVRAAKRREVVERAKELLATAFDEGAMDSEEILEEVRESVRVESVTEYAGLPAGPNVESSDAIIVVEGRADVTTLLGYGVKNAIAVEGTNVPDAVADLTHDRTVTAFLDGDRGGDLIRRELDQVGDLDYVAIAPEGQSVEDLTRAAVDRALRNKVPASEFDDEAGSSSEALPDSNREVASNSPEESTGREGQRREDRPAAEAGVEHAAAAAAVTDTSTDRPADESIPEGTAESIGSDPASDGEPARESDLAEGGQTGRSSDSAGGKESPDPSPSSLEGHVEAAIDRGEVRLLDDEMSVIDTAPAEDAFTTLRDANTVPRTAILAGEITQRLLDVAAQRGVATVVGTERGSFVKQPASVRVVTADELRRESGQ